MAQEDLLLPWLNVLDNVLLGYRLRNQNINKLNITHNAISLLRAVGLDNNLKQKPHLLSGGMRQRVALVRTFLEDHPIVLMDEPFSSLDAINRLYLQNFAASLLKTRTRLLVTHDPLEALRLADYIYVLAGSPATLNKPIVLNEPAPRDPTNSSLLTLHAKLIKTINNSSFFKIRKNHVSNNPRYYHLMRLAYIMATYGDFI